MYVDCFPPRPVETTNLKWHVHSYPDCKRQLLIRHTISPNHTLDEGKGSEPAAKKLKKMDEVTTVRGKRQTMYMLPFSKARNSGLFTDS